ncbi:MAG: GNAT family N-acetyltransferase [Candidatus Thorarchaeota archaeon]|nr:MAG: GNAT family N-acetyltransferase [Candidatus Thorarchaeota archaeon]
MELPDGFEFGIVKSDADLEELIKFNAVVHGDDDPEEIRRQIDNLPNLDRESNFYIRNLDKGIIVSAASAIPSVWMYEAIPLSNLELGWVGTLKEYRRKGLVRALYTHFEEILQRNEYHISTIMGIPYYYRQFGYDFILPMDRTVQLRVDQIPVPKNEARESIVFREASRDDIPNLMRLYDEHNSKMLVHAARTKDLWELQERFHREFEQEFKTMVLERDDRVVGYFRLCVRGEKKQAPRGLWLSVMESSITTFDDVLQTLQYLRTRAAEANTCRIDLAGPAVNNLCRVAQNLGGHVDIGWKYQIRIPNMTRFLEQIRPALESRFIGTMFEGLTRELAINTYEHCYILSFVNGKLAPVKDIGMQEVGEYRNFRAPPNDLVRLVLGDYNTEELRSQNIDFIVSKELKPLVETLFPKKNSFIAYYYC